MMSKIYVLCGIPGSGKSQWAETHKKELNAVVHSSDSIRAELLNDENDQSKNELVFKILHQRIKDDLRAGKNVIWDSTNLSRKNRVHFIKNELKGIPCEKVCILFACPFELCLARNFARDRQVPEEAMCRMYKSFTTPTTLEGFNDVQIVWADYKNMIGFEFDIDESLNRWKCIAHDNPWHSLSIGYHMIEAYVYMKKQTDNEHLLAAAILHDCGKPDVKSYINSKGEQTEIAHYYNHESISAYKSLFYLRNMYPEWSDKDILYVSLLINLHMRAHTAWEQSDKAKDKDRRLFGDDVMSDLELLYEADLAAH
jgi:predicted kinase